ncbi:hypothetical protein DID80_06120 [Candidatus Marinamargulisbacteria bacterium SCGC AAA071-K20]|nr:hypothetical protein DID80_06120 [Candidatus Marinamargulisbacteria bacterium SCGC AAA071-K20]
MNAVAESAAKRQRVELAPAVVLESKEGAPEKRQKELDSHNESSVMNLLSKAANLAHGNTVEGAVSKRFITANRGIESSIFRGHGQPDDLYLNGASLTDHVKALISKNWRTSVLEIGSATGHTLTTLFSNQYQQGKKLSCYGIGACRFSLPIYDENSSHYKSWLDQNPKISKNISNGGTLKFILGDAHELSTVVENKKFDLIFSNMTWMHLAHPLLALQEALSSLDHCGTLYIDRCFPDTQHKEEDIALIQQLLENHGFHVDIDGTRIEGIPSIGIEGYFVTKMAITKSEKDAVVPDIVGQFNGTVGKSGLQEPIIIYEKKVTP